jgi:hypothetical protein
MNNLLWAVPFYYVKSVFYIVKSVFYIVKSVSLKRLSWKL